MRRLPPSALLDATSAVDPTSLSAGHAEYIGPTVQRKRITAAFAIATIGAALLLARAFTLQVVRGDAYRALAEQNRTRTEIIVPTRGTIVDHAGRPLTSHVPEYAIGVVPADLPIGTERARVLSEIASALDRSTADLSTALAAYPATLSEPIPIRAGLAYDDAVRRYLAVEHTPAVQLVVRERRVLGEPGAPPIESLGHIVGYVGRVDAAAYHELAQRSYRPDDTIGRSGVEAAREADLRGTAGTRTVTVDARGRAVATVAVKPAIAGTRVALTVDRDLQAATEHALRTGARAVGARRGVAILMDADSGALLAMVSVPTFSATALNVGISEDAYLALVTHPDHPLFPRATTGMYPSGSTIKPFTAAAALAAGVISPTTRILSTGGIRAGGSFFPDWRADGHGAVTVREAIAQSVNTFFYVIGGGHPNSKFQIPNSKSDPLGPDRIAAALRAFGFGQPTGLDVAGEASGLVPTPAWKRERSNAPWYIGDTYHLAIGQGDLLVTPLQLARATATIANGGKLVTPHLVQQKRPVAAPMLDDAYRAVLSTIRTAMRATVIEGSARTLADLPFSVFGKTGTAQHAPNKRPHAWFIGFAEAPDRPNVRCQVSGVRCRSAAIVVLIEEGGEGSAAAVPVAREILSAWTRVSGY